MSDAAVLVLSLGCAVLLLGVGLAFWNRSNGGARVGSGRWLAVVILVSIGGLVALAPLVGMFLVSRL